MELLVAIFVVVIALWFWKSHTYERQTLNDFDTWVSSYDDASSPFKRSRMAVAFLHQSIHFAWTTGAINSKQKEFLTSYFKSQRATTSLTMLFGIGLPAVIRTVGKQDAYNTPARAVGMLMLLAWMAPDNDRDSAILGHLLHR